MLVALLLVASFATPQAGNSMPNLGPSTPGNPTLAARRPADATTTCPTPEMASRLDAPAPAAAAHRPHLWLESGLSLGVDAINDLPDFVVDVAGRRVGIVDRNRAAFELAWLPRLAYSFDFGLTLGLYGGPGFTGPSTPQLTLQLDTRGVHFATLRNHNTSLALSVMGGTFVGLRHTTKKGRYLLSTVGVHWRGHQNERLNSKLMVDLRFDVGFPLRRGLYLAIGPNVRLAAFSWGGVSASGMREVSFNLVGTLAYGR